MTVTTTLAAVKTLVSGLSPTSGAAQVTYAIPSDVTTAAGGGLSYSSFPVGIVAQRLGNDAGENNTVALGSLCEFHNYHVEIMIALVATETVNAEMSKGKHPAAVIMAAYEASAQLWLMALHTAVVADTTLGGLVRIGVDGSRIEDYRIGYLPWDNPGLFGLWASLAIQEDV